MTNDASGTEEGREGLDINTGGREEDVTGVAATAGREEVDEFGEKVV
jgi:hypothetical protein